jgi:hypothetical protein
VLDGQLRSRSNLQVGPPSDAAQEKTTPNSPIMKINYGV